MTAVRAVRRVRHVLRQQHLLAVGFGPQRISRFGRIKAHLGFYRLAGLVSAEEI